MTSFSYLQKQVLIGLLMGNGGLQTLNHGKTYRFRFVQSEVRKNYLFHIYKIFQEYVRTPPREMYDSRLSGKVYKGWYFNNLTSPEFNEYANLFYEQRRKVIKAELIPLVEKTALAYWFMDNGSKKGKNYKGFRFSTDAYSYKEVLLLQSLLEEKFDWRTIDVRQGQGFRISVKAESHTSLIKLVGDLIPDSMQALIS